MTVRELNGGCCKTYLLSDGGEAALVDPLLGKIDDYLSSLEKEKARLVWVLDTHTHADHLSGTMALAERTGATVVMQERAPARYVGRRVKEGDRLPLGATELEFLDTPGHTEDSLMMRAGDDLFTGDALFIGAGGAGRTDLRGGDPGQHYDSLVKLRALPDNLAVWPGHDYRGNTSSTLRAERAANPRLAALGSQSREAYAQGLAELKLPPAPWMEQVLDINTAGTKDPHAVVIPTDAPTCEVGGTMTQVAGESPVATIYPFEVAERVGAGESLVLVDVREPHEWNDQLGHVRGAQLIPLGTLPAGAEHLPRASEIITICRSGKRSATAARALGKAGFANVASMTGGMMAWNEAQLAVERE